MFEFRTSQRLQKLVHVSNWLTWFTVCLFVCIVCTFCCSTLFCCGDLELNPGPTPFIWCHNCGQRIVKKCSCGQSMRKRSKAFVKSCDFVQTVPTTHSIILITMGLNLWVGTPQSVGIKGQFIPAPHKVLVLIASLFQPRHKVLNEVSYASFLLNRLALECVHKNADLAIIIEPQ